MPKVKTKILYPENIDGNNNERADYAREALEIFKHRVGLIHHEERETAISDLLANLRHLCDEDGLNYARAHNTGLSNYRFETGREQF